MPEATAASRVPASRTAALFLVSAGLLMLQVALTKVFSIVLWYHFGFLAISIALLGFAAAGVWLVRRPEVLEGGGGALARLAALAAASTAGVLWLVVHTDVDAMTFVADRDEGAMLFRIGVLLVPFFFLGAVVSATLTLHRDRAGGVYASNLLGSGAGCGLAVLLFDLAHLSAPDVVLWSALLMAVAGVLYAASAGGRGAVGSLAALAGLVALLLLPARHDWFQLDAPPSKPLWHVEEWERNNRPMAVTLQGGERLVFTGGYRPEGDGFVVRDPYGDERFVPADLVPRNPDGSVPVEPASLVEFTEWSSLSRVDAFTWPAGAPPWGLWGLSPAWRGEHPRQKGITIDTWAMTNVLEWDRAAGPPPEIVEYLPASLVHHIVDEPEILIVGAGGGMDVLTAERFGASRIVGVEINPSIVKAVREEYLDFQGGLYDPARSPHVEIHVAEGRHFLEQEERRFDVVQLSGVDTASTTQAGAFSLSENNLYTIEAFDTYLERTKDDGFVTLTRWVLPDQVTGEPRETLRLFTLAWAALERARDRGDDVPDVAASLYLIDSQGFSVIVFGREPFTDEQIAALDETRDALGARSLYHPRESSRVPHPTTREPMEVNWYEAFAAAPDKAAFFEHYGYDVAPPTDNRPFFFETSKFRHLLRKGSFFNPLGGLTAHAIVVVLLALLGVAAFAFVLLPLRRLRHQVEGGLPAPVLVYFGCLGLGFILVEVVLTQQFNLYLGNPLYALAVVLASVLVFSGVGSALSSRVGEPRRALAVVIGLAAVYPLLLDPVFDATIALSTPARIAISVALLAPLSLAMGMPFPLGLGRIAARDSRLTAWAWGVNGYTSVVGSVLTIVLSLAFGFRAVVWIGALVYVLAFVVAPRLRGGATRAA